ncbi:hypothetical protein [Microcoleus sp. FACHB-SPT15]|nr:hypothetical protein [Microcoleus sp. FACHB-SPT15]
MPFCKEAQCSPELLCSSCSMVLLSSTMVLEAIAFLLPDLSRSESK